MKKKILLRFISMALIAVFTLTALIALIPSVSAAVPTDKTVKFNNPAIGADTGETIDLSLYSAELTYGNVCQASSIVWTSSDITVLGGKVTPTAKGVYKLTAASGNTSKTIYLVVKAPTETEYVLYSNDFSDESTLDDFSVDRGTLGTISDGKLSMSAQTKLILPSWLGDFGNYDISASATITSAVNSSRWMSIMYRYQGDTYYQMAVRQNAALNNGVEIARMKSNGEWDVTNTTSYNSALSPSTFYTFNISVLDNAVEQTLSGSPGGSNSSMSNISVGKIGIQTDNCTALVDDIKVCARFGRQGMAPTVAATRKPTSEITLAPSMIYEVTDAAALADILTNSPAVALMTLNAQGKIIDKTQKVICGLSEAVSALNGQVIPAIKLGNGCSPADAAEIIKSAKLKEIMFISHSAQEISGMRYENSNVLCIFDMSNKDLEGQKLWEIRSSVLSLGARGCILPANMATQRNTDALNTMGVTVWYTATEGTEEEMFTLVTSGANGIITADRKLMDDVLASPVFMKNSIIRPVSNIGHRGTPALAPELTVEGSSLAATKGANIIENDVYISTDGVVVVMHDNTLATITNGTGNVESMTYAEIKEYYITDEPDLKNSGHETIKPPLPIATLEDYFKCFKGTDTFLFIEIKSSQSDRIASAIKQLIEKYDIAEQCGVISFNVDALKAVRTLIPEISVGSLSNSNMSLTDVIQKVSALESSYNSAGTHIDAELVRELAARSIFTWPWTIQSSYEFDKFLLMGVGGVTTDNSYFAENYIRFLYPEKSEYTFSANSSLNVNIIAEKYGALKGDKTFANIAEPTKEAEMIVLSGNDSIKLKDGYILTAANEGDATVLFRMGYKLNSEKTVYVYSQPVTIHVTAKDSSNGASSQSTSNQSSDSVTNTVQKPVESKGCGSALTSGTAIVLVLTLGSALLVRRRED